MGTINWIYNKKDFTEDMIGDSVGFVYLITNLTNNKKYIGKKLFNFRRTKTIRGKKKKLSIASDWLTYYGSSDILKEEVSKLGEANFKREILHLCSSKGMCNYLEAKEQFLNNVLESDEYYNSWISCKVHKSHVRNKIDKTKI